MNIEIRFILEKKMFKGTYLQIFDYIHLWIMTKISCLSKYLSTVENKCQSFFCIRNNFWLLDNKFSVQLTLHPKMGKWLFSKNHIHIRKWLWNVHPILLRLKDYIGWSQCSTCSFSGKKNKWKKNNTIKSFKKWNGTLNRTRYIHQSLSKYKLSYSISRPFDHTAASKVRYMVTMWQNMQ